MATAFGNLSFLPPTLRSQEYVRIHGRPPSSRSSSASVHCSISPHSVLHLPPPEASLLFPRRRQQDLPLDTGVEPRPPSTTWAERPKWNFIQRAAAAALDKLEDVLIVSVLERRQPPPRTVDPAVQLAGNFAPVGEHPPAYGLPVTGRIPDSIAGVYVRNGPNPFLPPASRHHLFDGDGMLHAVRISHGAATYACRFTTTERLLQDRSAGRSVSPRPIGEMRGGGGVARLLLYFLRAACRLVDPARGAGVANAGLVFFNRRLLALSEDDLPYHVRVTTAGDLETVGRCNFDGQLDSAMIAHPKLDPATKELFAFSYNVIRKPHLKYFYFSSTGKKSDDVPIPLDRPTMVHDFAITENFVVVPDQQIEFRLHEMVLGRCPVVCNKKKVPRFGVLPKYSAGSSEMKWVDVPECFCFHLWNAWEKPAASNSSGDGEIVVIASCMTPADSIFKDSDDNLQIVLSEIRLNLATGESSRRRILPTESHMNLEAGMVNRNYLGRKTRYVYLAIADPWPMVSGFAKVDLLTGESRQFLYGDRRCGGEPCFVPRGEGEEAGASSREDDGYLMAFVHDENTTESELLIVNAGDMKVEAKLKLPSRVPYGFHGTFIDSKDLETQA